MVTRSLCWFRGRAAGEWSGSLTGDHRVLGTCRGVERAPMASGAGPQTAHSPPPPVVTPSLTARVRSYMSEPGLPLSSHLHEHKLII